MSNCRVCQTRTNAYLCPRCLGQIRHALKALPDLLRELDTTITRQDRGTGAPLYAMNRSRVQIPGLHYDEGDNTLPSTQWPFAWDASEVRFNIEWGVHVWARHIAETRRVRVPAGPICRACRHDSCRTVRRLTIDNPGRFLLDNLNSIRFDEAAAEIHDQIRALERDARQAIDRQVPDLFAGRCEAMLMTATEIEGVVIPELAPCGTDLYARTGDEDVKCPTCGATYDLIEQDRKLKAAMPEACATPKVIADGLSTPEQPLNASTLRTWIERDARIMERVKVGPVCLECTHRSCEALRAGELALLVRLHGRPLIPRRGWDSEGRSIYRAGDVQARMAWNLQQQNPRKIGA